MGPRVEATDTMLVGTDRKTREVRDVQGEGVGEGSA